MTTSGAQTESRWEDALRTAQEELDALRDKHARERQRLEQHFHGDTASDSRVAQLTTAPSVDELLTAEADQRIDAAVTDEVKAPQGDSATDQLRLHEQLLKASDQLRRQTEEVSAVHTALCVTVSGHQSTGHCSSA